LAAAGRRLPVDRGPAALQRVPRPRADPPALRPVARRPLRRRAAPGGPRPRAGLELHAAPRRRRLGRRLRRPAAGRADAPPARLGPRPPAPRQLDRHHPGPRPAPGCEPRLLSNDRQVGEFAMSVQRHLKDLAISETGFVFDPYTGATFTTNATGHCVLVA